MASAINALRNIISDKLWLLKVIILALPVYFYYTDRKLIMNFFEDDLIFWAVLSVIYLGVCSVLIHRNINNKVPILPSFLDVFDIIRRMVGCLLSALPGLVVLYGVFYALNTYFSYLSANVLTILHIVCVIILFPFICIPIVIFSVNAKITDIFRVHNVQSASGDFIVSLVTFIVQYLLTIALFTYLIYEAVKTFYGADFIGIPILFSFVIALSFLMVFSWASDLYGNQIPEIDENTNKKTKKNINN